MTPEVIRAIRSEQAEYDSNPEAYERRERQRIEQRLLEQEQERQEYERLAEGGRIW
jgi:hypothetical protein